MGHYGTVVDELDMKIDDSTLWIPNHTPVPLPKKLRLDRATYSGWWFQTMEFYFPFHIWDVILPIDELHHFSRWAHCTTKQILLTIINHIITININHILTRYINQPGWLLPHQPDIVINHH